MERTGDFGKDWMWTTIEWTTMDLYGLKPKDEWTVQFMENGCEDVAVRARDCSRLFDLTGCDYVVIRTRGVYMLVVVLTPFAILVFRRAVWAV